MESQETMNDKEGIGERVLNYFKDKYVENYVYHSHTVKGEVIKYGIYCTTAAVFPLLGLSFLGAKVFNDFSKPYSDTGGTIGFVAGFVLAGAITMNTEFRHAGPKDTTNKYVKEMRQSTGGAKAFPIIFGDNFTSTGFKVIDRDGDCYFSKDISVFHNVLAGRDVVNKPNVVKLKDDAVRHLYSFGQIPNSKQIDQLKEKVGDSCRKTLVKYLRQ